MNALVSVPHIYNPKTFSLDNGLHVVLIPNSFVDSVGVGLAYAYGSADDPLELVGLAHFLEHMMFKGSKKFPKGEFDKKIMQWGGSLNAWTWYDQTVYHEQVPANRLKEILEMEADRMHNLSFDEAEVVSERDVVYQERLMRIDNNPFGQVYEAYLQGCFWYHPYKTPVIGYAHHIHAYNYDNVRKAYETWYAPNNATLIISGKYDEDDVRSWVGEFFGSIPQKELPKRLRPKEPAHQNIVHHVTQENKRNSLILLEWNYAVGNHRTSLNDSVDDAHKAHESKAACMRDYNALNLLAHMMAGNTTKKLYRLLVEDEKVALHVSTNYMGHLLDPYLFSIQVTTAEKELVARIEDLLSNYIKELIDDGVSEDELHKAKRDLLAHSLFAKDGVMNPIEYFCDVTMGWTIHGLDTAAQKIMDITQEDLARVIKDVFSKKPVCRADLYPS